MPDSLKPRVLSVDDERAIADVIAMILNQSGFEAHTAYSGEEAIEVAPSIKPDIIISGIVMYELNGVEAAILLHGMLPDARIILHSGWAGAATCSRTRGIVAMSSRLWRSQFTPRICSTASVHPPIRGKSTIPVVFGIRLTRYRNVKHGSLHPRLKERQLYPLSGMPCADSSKLNDDLACF